MIKRTAALLIALGLSVGLTGCMDPQEPNRRDGAVTGERVRPFEEDSVKRDLEDAGDAVRRGVEDTGDAIRRGAEDVGEALEGTHPDRP